MGCEVQVAGASAWEVAAVERLFAARDARFSRFRADSELSWVNAHAGGEVIVSSELARMLRCALALAEATDGLVDPTVGSAIAAAGYDVDFALLGRDRGPLGAVSPATGAWRAVRLRGRALRLPAGCRLDLNGVVKAATADDALALLAGDGFVSAGGDVAVRGPLDVALPGGGAVRVLGGGIATSGSARRRWLRGGEWQHHLIDPTTARPARSPWSEVTVAGASCLAADVAAKAAFLRGVAGPAWLDSLEMPGRFLDAAGQVLLNRRWTALVGEPACT